MYEGKAAAAATFKRGDVLALSAAGELTKHALDAKPFAGIAAAGAAEAINGRVTYIIPGADAVFLADCKAGQTFAVGEQVGFANDATLVHVVDKAAVTKTLVVMKTEKEVDGIPERPRVAVRFIREHVHFT